MNLADALDGSTPPPVVRCHTAKLLAVDPTVDAAIQRARERGMTWVWIGRVLADAGQPVSDSSLRRHYTGKCGCGRG